MGSNGASGGGSADAPNTTRSTLSAKNQAKADKKTNDSLVGTSDYQGDLNSKSKNNNNNNNGGNGGDGMNTSGVVVQAPTVVAPTTAEISQSEATKAEDPIEVRKRKTLAKGRSSTIITRSTGVTGDLTLGKPSLLGR